jgi:hypothetical protein
MQKYLWVITPDSGIVYIDCETGTMSWEEEGLDPVLKQYAKKYLVQEGFLEQALGILDPEPNESADLFFDAPGFGQG